jgi:hypothetical protein
MAVPLLKVEVGPDDPRPAAVNAAFGPGVRLAVQAGCALDTVRSIMTSALLDEAVHRFGPDLPSLSLALGRTTRSLRSALRSPTDFQPKGHNLVDRARVLLRERPLSVQELGGELPQYYEFDAASVVIQAGVSEGWLTPVVVRGQPRRYQATDSAPPTSAPADWSARLAATQRHMRAVAGALRRGATHTRRGRLRQRDLEQLTAEVEAFIATHPATAGAPDGVEAAVYLGWSAGED